MFGEPKPLITMLKKSEIKRLRAEAGANYMHCTAQALLMLSDLSLDSACWLGASAVADKFFTEYLTLGTVLGEFGGWEPLFDEGVRLAGVYRDEYRQAELAAAQEPHWIVSPFAEV